MPAALQACTSSAAPRVEPQPLVVHLVHAGNAHALEQGHAPAQAFLVVGDFATHRRFGDGGHLGLAARRVGDFVHALDVDEGRVHVERDQLEVAEFPVGRGDVDNEAGGGFGGGHVTLSLLF
jgi:hypothetical protein